MMTSGSKKCRRGYGGVWQGLCLLEVWSQAVGFVFVRTQESDFSRREDVFIFNLLYKEVSQVLYFKFDFQGYRCNKSYYYSTQKRFIAVNFDGSFSARFSRSNIKENRIAPTVHVPVTHIPRAIFRFRTRVLLVEDPDLIQTVSS
jgi:hypothetical protein